MQALLKHMIQGLVKSPNALQINTVEGEASVLYELTVAPSDVDSVKGAGGETLRALRTVLSASSGERRAVLELSEPGAPAGEASAE